MRERELMVKIDFPTTFSEFQATVKARLEKAYDEDRNTLEKIYDDLIESPDWRAKVALLEIVWGKPKLQMEHSGEVATVFKVEYSEDWKLEVTEAEEDVVDATYTVLEDDTNE